MIVVVPTERTIGEEEEPLEMRKPLIVTVELAFVAVGVTIIVSVALATESVYESVVDEKIGERVPAETVREAREEFVDVAFDKMFILKDVVAVTFPVSVAEQTTLVVPIGKIDPEGGIQETVVVPSTKSVAVGVANDTAAPALEVA